VVDYERIDHRFEQRDVVVGSIGLEADGIRFQRVAQDGARLDWWGEQEPAA